MLLAQAVTLLIEKNEMKWLIWWNLYEERSIGLDRRGAQCNRVSLGIESLEPDLRRCGRKCSVARLARVESKKVGVVPVVQCRRMLLRSLAGSDQHGINKVFTGA